MRLTSSTNTTTGRVYLMKKSFNSISFITLMDNPKGRTGININRASPLILSLGKYLLLINIHRKKHIFYSTLNSSTKNSYKSITSSPSHGPRHNRNTSLLNFNIKTKNNSRNNSKLTHKKMNKKPYTNKKSNNLYPESSFTTNHST